MKFIFTVSVKVERSVQKGDQIINAVAFKNKNIFWTIATYIWHKCLFLIKYILSLNKFYSLHWINNLVYEMHIYITIKGIFM